MFLLIVFNFFKIAFLKYPPGACLRLEFQKSLANFSLVLWNCFFLLFQDVLSDKDRKFLLCLLFTILQILCIIFQVRGVVFANVENVFVKTITLERIAGKLIALLLPRIAWAPIRLVESYLNR